MAPVAGSPGSTGRARGDRVGRGRRSRRAARPVEVRQQDRERHLERQVGSPRLEGQHGGRAARPREPGVQQRRAAGSRDDRARPGGEHQLRRLGDVGRRQVHVAQDRVVGIQRRRSRGSSACPVTLPSGARRGGAMARIGPGRQRRRAGSPRR